MTTDDLKQTNIGRKVLIGAIGPFENCRATLRINRKFSSRSTALTGKAFNPGRVLEVPIDTVRFAKRNVTEDGRQWVPVSHQQ